MSFQASRLRRGEILAGAAAVVLLVDLFAIGWYTTGAMSVSRTGWQAVAVLRWLLLLTGVSGLALTWLQGTRRTPAVPVSVSVIVTTLGVVTLAALVIRLLAGAPALLGDTSAAAGLWVGIVAVVALTASALLSLRDEDPPDPDRNAAIPIVPLPR